jgi:hypothetical protein
MNISTIIAIIFGWLLFNTWLSYLILVLAKEDVSYNELHWLILASVITPLTVPIINLIIERRRERRRKNDR